MRKKLPFGVAQIGKAFRNEITPGNFTFRTREFEQMEQQYFVHPNEKKKYFDMWQEARMKWYEEFGIKKEHIAHIFDEFRQADSGTARKYGGTGLGLSIAKKYAELLGGSIKVESEENKGYLFTIILPIQFNDDFNTISQKSN